MTDVEFVDPTPPGPPTPHPGQTPAQLPVQPDPAPVAPVPLPSLRQLAASVAFWVVAAACAVAAPFTQLYGVKFPGGPNQAVDGWGRVTVDAGPDAGIVDTPGHDVRYGIAYVVVAAVLAVLVALTLTRRRVHLTHVAALVAPGVLAGVTAVVALDIDALVSRIHGYSAGPAIGGSGSAGPTIVIGPMVWLSLAAVIGAAVAAALLLAPRAVRLPARGRRAPRAVEAPPHRDDELLD